MDQAELVKIFGGVFAIMNPFVNLPIFLALTSGFTVAQQRLLAAKVTLFSAIMCGVILFLGQKIIAFFGITIDEFRIAGGIVLAQISFSMLNGKEVSSHHSTDGQQVENLSGLAFYPMTFPMIVGPGTLATLIIYAGHAQSTLAFAETAAIVGVVLLLLFVVFFFSSLFEKALTQTMRVIMTRLMGMILLTIAVEMVVDGVKAVFAF